MATSGTYTFGVTTESIDIITEAFERCGIDGSLVSSVQLESARRSIDMLFTEWANRGPNLWSIELVTLPLIADTLSYILDVKTVYIVQAATRTTSGSTNTDLIISPMSRAEYLALPNKALPGYRPTQFYFERLATPKLYVWPVPQTDDISLIYYRMNAIQDVGAYINNLDAPARWMDAIAAGLAARLAVKYAPDRIAQLRADAEQAYTIAMQEDRERVPYTLSIDTPGYFV